MPSFNADPPAPPPTGRQKHGASELAHQVEDLHLGPNAPRGPKKRGANSAQPLTQIPASYEGWVLHKAESLPGEKKSWSRIEKNPMPLSEAQLASKLKSKKWRKPPLDAYRSLPLQSQRDQINRLFASRNEGEIDPHLVWSLAGIDTRIERNCRTRRLETAEIYVILKRNAKFSAVTRTSHNSGDDQGVSGDIVDLRDPIKKPKNKKVPGKKNNIDEGFEPPPPPLDGVPAPEGPLQAIPMQNSPARPGEPIDVVPPSPPVPPLSPPLGEPRGFPSMRTGSPHRFKQASRSPRLVPRDNDFFVDGEVEDDHDDDVVHTFEEPRTGRRNPVKKIRARVSRVPPRPAATHAHPPPIHHHQAPRRPPAPPHAHRRLIDWSDSADDDDGSSFGPSDFGTGTPPSTSPMPSPSFPRHRNVRQHWDSFEPHRIPRHARGHGHFHQTPVPNLRPPHPRDGRRPIMPVANDPWTHHRRPSRRAFQEPHMVQPAHFVRRSFDEEDDFDDFDSAGFRDGWADRLERRRWEQPRFHGRRRFFPL
ncbi:hypothetical protein EV356DRAFT_528828 [Viridothelium virens]|uniref:Uncharacterized protein n=1 Tax=Viridothelium virens TaxID=1048519 RepID=A0A6A6HM66_VIRVR|nr:hypothetical protein EV356DRAFT_528828 [Viridothelium virens]